MDQRKYRTFSIPIFQDDILVKFSNDFVNDPGGNENVIDVSIGAFDVFRMISIGRMK
jgi:hypothetical protein